jgi:uncharacterized protein (TIGR02001 family)
MKKTTLALAALVAGVSAQAQTAESPLSVSVDVTVVSDYVFRGVHLAGTSLQPSVEVAYGDFYVGAWNSNTLSSTGINETDVYAGYGFAINETYSLDVGLTRYLYDGQSTGDTTEAYVGVSADLFGLSPSLYYYHDFDLETNAFIHSIGYSFPVDAINTSLDFAVTVGHVRQSENLGGNYTYGSLGVAIPYSLSETATLTVGGEYIRNDTRALGTNNNRRDGFVGSVGLSIGF